MIYHVLPEQEPFSAIRGGAISHTCANLLRLDKNRSVVCADADESWQVCSERIITLPMLQRYHACFRGRRFVPLSVMKQLLQRIFSPFLGILQPGDVVWCHNRPVFAAAMAPWIKAHRARLIYHSHDALNFHAARVAFSDFNADAYVFVSEFLRNYWCKVLPNLSNTHTVHNGADEKLFFPACASEKPDRDSLVVLFVGRLAPEKGIHVLLSAMHILTGRGIEVDCRVIGSSFSGGSKPTTFSRSLQKSIPSNTKFLGSHSALEIANQYRQADVFCCPSTWNEPFGKVNVEAMACGIPVVATHVGGIPEIGAHGGMLLVEPNSPRALASAIETVVGNRSLRKQLSHEASESFRKHFTWKHALEKYSAIVEGIR